MQADENIAGLYPKIRGSLVSQLVRCGKARCKCSHGGPRHGPYLVLITHMQGMRHKEYVKKQDAQFLRAAVAAYREHRRQERQRIQEDLKFISQCRDDLRRISS